MIVYLNGNFVEEERAKISPFDHGFLLGMGVFETLRAYNGKIFALDRHLERMEKGASFLKIPFPKNISRILYLLLEKNNLRDAYVRVTLSRGEEKTFRQKPSSPNIFAFALPFAGYPERIYSKGVHLKILPVRRGESPFHEIKTTSNLENIYYRLWLEEKGFDEGLFLSTEEEILEGTASNIFLLKDGKLFTPARNVLPGITRETVINLANEAGIEVREESLHLSELFKADEVFLTSTLIEVAPVTQVEGRKIGSGVPGETTLKLLSKYRERVGHSSGKRRT
jgi:branched-chain amino acid aminotransferase